MTVFPGFFTPVLTQLSFQSTFLTCFRGEMQKYAGKKVYPDWVSNLPPPGHESDHSPLSHLGGACKKVKRLCDSTTFV